MKKSVLIMFHLLFWIFTSLMVMLVFQILEAGIAMLKIGAPVKINTIALNFVPLIIVLPIGACIFYTSYFSFKFFIKRPVRFVWVVLAYILYILAFSLPGYFAAKASHVSIDHLRGFFAIALIVSPILYFNVFGFLFQAFMEWIGDRKIKAELEKDKLINQLELLTSKINPHFLFNTINNIDVLIEKDAVKASVYLNKLSDILRFMLYEIKTEKIPLEKELSYIEKYIDLQKIRTSNTNNINYSVKGEIKDLMIEPMLFIPFIENAFKHSESIKATTILEVNFFIEKERITFECLNTYGATSLIKTESGIGNALIEKRLSLLYPNKHSLQINDKDGTYKVKLVLNEN